MSTPLEIADFLDEMTAWYGWTNTNPPRQMFKPTEKQAEMWASLLGDLPLAAIVVAWRQWLADSKYPPAPSDLRALARGLTTPADEATPDADEAWAEVIGQIARVGHTGTPTWSHPAIAEAVRGFGGWRLLCAMEIEQTATHRAQFRDVFNAVKGRAARAQTMLPDVRAFAQATGALPRSVPPLHHGDEDVPALPAPEPASRDLSAPPAPASLADFRRYRAEQVAEREAQGRAAFARWQAEEGAQDAAQ